MATIKRKVSNIRTGKILELTEVAIANLKKMGKFSDYDILPDDLPRIPEIKTPPTPPSTPVAEEVIIPETETETETEEPKKKKKKPFNPETL